MPSLTHGVLFPYLPVDREGPEQVPVGVLLLEAQLDGDEEPPGGEE